MYKAYGDLYANLKRNLAQVVRIAPEMYNLFWCDGYEDEASINTTMNPLPVHYVSPRIKVFENPVSDRCYLFYLNTFCRAERTPYEITFNSSDLPEWADCTARLLDHSRRFIMDGTESPAGTFTFLDTLGPGEARLVELISTSLLIPADVRITDNDNDVWATLPARGDTATIDMTAVPGESVNIAARFYNMGTGSRSNIVVGMYDTSTSPETTIDTDTIRFSGLPYGSGNCRTEDRVQVIFNWNNISTSDIGPHKLEVRAKSWPGEPDPDDNTARVTFLVEPNDWATEVRSDPWDMTEATSGIPAWYTNDISAMYGWVSSSYTDSVSGMFEGSVSDSHLHDNRMYLNCGGETIDGDECFDFNLIGKTRRSSDVYLGWTDTHNHTGIVKIGEMDNTWHRLGVADMSGSWSGLEIKELWLSFRPSGSVVLPVRIGWLTLENGEL